MDAPLTPVPALVLCGGRGTRLGGSTEKPLVTVCDEPMVDRVVRALEGSRVSTTHAVTSPHTPETRARAADVLGVDTIDAPGQGYVEDLRYALDHVAEPVLTVVADLPHLAPEHVERALADACAGGTPTSLTVCVPVDLKHRLGVSVDTAFDHEGRELAPTGLNVVAGGTETVSVVDDERLAVNVNHPRDREVAEERCD
ncbi:NTP transferase domain-containing protein [Salinigranum halophilum]|uniref:NTP transferase domain-containing protein n=1 Tax=Salinigranum halophilum TaxID=2565931 RepID=UPI001F481824|nr:NTP transferase domain-containing protein [Salinigranum halophilum]